MKTLDARGLSCPEPVIMIRRAMMSKEPAYEIVVDNITSRENVTRYAEHQGYKVSVSGGSSIDARRENLGIGWTLERGGSRTSVMQVVSN